MTTATEEKKRERGRPVFYHFYGAQQPPHGRAWIFAIMHPDGIRAQVTATRTKLGICIASMRRSVASRGWRDSEDKFVLRFFEEVDDGIESVTEGKKKAASELEAGGFKVSGMRRTLAWVREQMDRGMESEIRKMPNLGPYADIVSLERRVRDLELMVFQMASKPQPSTSNGPADP